MKISFLENVDFYIFIIIISSLLGFLQFWVMSACLRQNFFFDKSVLKFLFILTLNKVQLHDGILVRLRFSLITRIRL